MAWPTGIISTANLDAGDDSVAAARTAILAAVQGVNDIAASRGVANGIPSLDAGGKLPSAQVPDGIIPAGVMLQYGGSAAPTGWLLCYGQAVSRTTYADLFAAIGTAFGVGDGSTTFNLPDARGRVLAGKDDMGGIAANRMNVSLAANTSAGSAVVTGLSSTSDLAVGMKVSGSTIPANATIATIDSGTQVTMNSGTGVTAGTGVTLRFGVVDGATLGDAGGTHVHTLTTPQMPSHNHTLTNVTSTSAVGTGGTSGILNTFGSGFNTTNTGGGQAHPNVQPTLVTNTIIKT